MLATRAPPTYRGMRGPGTFEIVRLKTRGPATSRAARTLSGLGSCPMEATSASDPVRCWACLSWTVWARMRSTLVSGSRSPTGSSTNANTIRLPSAPSSPCPSTLTGTIARRETSSSSHSAAAESAGGDREHDVVQLHPQPRLEPFQPGEGHASGQERALRADGAIEVGLGRRSADLLGEAE